MESSDGIYIFDFSPPVPMDIEKEEAINLWMERGKMYQCNTALSKMYGLNSSEELIGTPLSHFLSITRPENMDMLQRFYEARCSMIVGRSVEIDAEGRKKVFSNTFEGVIRNDQLIRVWGCQREISDDIKSFEIPRDQATPHLVVQLDKLTNAVNSLMSLTHGVGVSKAAVDSDLRVNPSESIVLTSARVSTLETELAHLRKLLVHGNGAAPLLSRVEGLEREVNTNRSSYRFWLPVAVSFMSLLVAAGSFLSVLLR